MVRDRRRWVIAAGVAAVPVVLSLGFGHRGVHAVRSMLVPGSGLLEARPVLAAAFLALAVTATVSWLRWGVDWAVVAVVAAAMAASAAWGSVDHGDEVAVRVRAAHEFPLVLAVVGALGWARAVLGRAPGFGWLAGRRAREDDDRSLTDLAPVDRCRAVAIAALAGDVTETAAAGAAADDVARRARRVGLAARLRRGGDPFRGEHAHARAALALTGQLDHDARQRFVADADASPVGVPASEPGWVRILDATLAAAALEELGEQGHARRWSEVLSGPLAVRRGHRPAWLWSPLGLAAGRTLDWEHAAATAIARSRGWNGADDWPVLRQRVLGAAARGTGRRDDERLVAAGRVWLALVDDPAAERIVARPTVRHDPLAVALDTYATRLRAEPPDRVPLPTGGTP